MAERFSLPVATTFRCQDYIDNAHPNYGGVIGIAPLPELRRKVREEVDLLITVGSRFGEMTTQGYTLIDSPVPQMRFVHVHPGPEELGHVYAPDLSIVSSPANFLRAMLAQPTVQVADDDWISGFRADFEAFLKPTEVAGDLNMGEVIRHVSENLPNDTVYANGAGNYSVWLHRFHAHREYRTQLAPTSGSMGYSVPAAIAAKLENRNRTVVSVAGDGCFLMTSQEMATAKQYGLAIIYLVVNNGMYGTIRMHQERNHPGRVISTELQNPDFVTYANSFGIPGETVTRTDQFRDALSRAQASEDGYLIELQVDPEALTPTQSLSAARAGRAGNKGLTMIVEERIYSLNIGAVPLYLKQYEEEGLAIQRSILGRMVGYFSTEIGPLHQIVHLWAYKDLQERAERRARLTADPRWKEYALKTRDLQISQENKILIPAPFSPWANDDPALDLANNT